MDKKSKAQIVPCVPIHKTLPKNNAYNSNQYKTVSFIQGLLCVCMPALRWLC